MRNLTKSSAIAFAALALALVALPALASDPDPMLYSKCSTGCGWSVTTTGPAPCDNGANTCITYNVTGTGVPDHLGIFLRSEANLLWASGPYSISTACGKGDTTLGLGSNLLCHERLIRFDNRVSKAVTFSLKVEGKRSPIITTVTTRKGYTQCANPIVGIGLEPAPAPAACVNSCGNFNPKQSVRTEETFKFESCAMHFTYKADGSVDTFSVEPLAEGANCTKQVGLISDIFASHVPEGEQQGAFGDGWLNTGSNSCSTRMVGGSYYTVCW